MLYSNTIQEVYLYFSFDEIIHAPLFQIRGYKEGEDRSHSLITVEPENNKPFQVPGYFLRDLELTKYPLENKGVKKVKIFFPSKGISPSESIWKIEATLNASSLIKMIIPVNTGN